jgi:hypothetical protein
VVGEIENFDQRSLHKLRRCEGRLVDNSLTGSPKLQRVVNQPARHNRVPQCSFQDFDLLVVELPILVLFLQQGKDSRFDHCEGDLQVMDQKFKLDSVFLHKAS